MPFGLGIGLCLDLLGQKVSTPAPTAPAGANYALLSHPSYWASDASHLVPCSAGDAIRWWKDAVTGTWYEQATSGSRLIARQDATGKWYAEGAGLQRHPWVLMSGQSATNVTLAAAYRQYTAVNGAGLIGCLPRDLSFFTTTLKPASAANNNIAAIASASADSLNTDYRNIVTSNGTTLTLYHNGSQVAQSLTDTTTGTLTNPAYAFGYSAYPSAYMPNGRLYGAVIFKTGSVDIASLDASLQGYCTA